MSALLCCGPCFDSHNLSEDGAIYRWLDMLLESSDDKVSILIYYYYLIDESPMLLYSKYNVKVIFRY